MKFGLIGNQVSHSLSKAYFTDKFSMLGLNDFSYDLISIPNVQGIMEIMRGAYFGLNVTKPYKSEVISFLNQVDTDALHIGAVNTLVRTGANSWKGFNTDQIGFEQSLLTWISVYDLPQKALVLGSGGASRAVVYVLSRLGIEASVVSRTQYGDITYDQVTPEVLNEHPLIVNTTPIGMAPKAGDCPQIPYHSLTNEHWVYDLVYNPLNTLFLTKSQQAGARIKNGLEMLYLQADYAWSIWKSYGKF